MLLPVALKIQAGVSKKLYPHLWAEAETNAARGHFENPYPDESTEANVYRLALRQIASPYNH